MVRRISHVIGFDDAPFPRSHRGNVLVIGAVYAGLRLEGVLSGKVRRDGTNSTHTVIRLVLQSRFARHMQAILLQGITFAGFNVIDLQALFATLGIPIIVVSRKQPDLAAIKRALLERVPGGKKKWALIEQAGLMESVAGVFIQHRGISLLDTERLIKRLAVHSALPEPLRTAHLIAGGVATGESRHRP
jgi:endonuclease V-like protein UPF0215 family